MLTDKDIDRITAVVATKQDVQNLADRVDKLEDTQARILSGLDRLATVIERDDLESAAMSAQLSRHDRWIHQVADETKVTLTA